MLPPETRKHCTSALLRDGTRVCIRAVRPEYKQLLATEFGILSKHSICLGFFLAKKELSEKDLVNLTEVDYLL